MKNSTRFRPGLLACLAISLLLGNALIAVRYNYLFRQPGYLLNRLAEIQVPSIPVTLWKTAQVSLDDVTGSRISLTGRAAYARLENARPQVFAAHQRWVSSVTWSPTSRWFASGAADASVNIWQPGNSQQIYSLSVSSPVTAVACSPNGLLLAAATNTGQIYLWHTEDWSPAGKFASSFAVTALAWSPNSKKLATGTSTAFTSGNDVLIWNIADGSVETHLTAHKGSIRAIAWSPDGALLASGGDDATVKVWHIGMEDGERSSLLRDLATGSRVDSLGWNPRQGTLFAGTAERQVLAWEARHWLPVTLPMAQGQYALAWSPDAIVLATAVAGEVHLWGAISRAEFAHLSSAGSEVTALAWSPDGKWLAVGVGSGAGQSPDENNILLWPVQ